jgi:ABC-type lipoprotein export system ATPase subunit
MGILTFDAVGKKYGEGVILQGCSFDVSAGQSVAFVSPSGSGKSTLLSIAGLLLEPSSGQVLVDGQPTAGLSDAELSNLRQKTFGFIFQHTQLVGSLRALENVAAPASFARGLDFDAKARARELLCAFGLEKRLDHYPYQLSIGQKRRVAAARALLMKPRIIIADEPTNDLDAQSAQTVADTLFEQVERGCSLLFATHDKALARRADVIMNLEGNTFVPAAADEI